MWKLIDEFLNRITMYRLVLYYLVFLWGVALILSFFGLLPFSPGALILSLAFMTAVSWITNTIFAGIYKVPANVESIYITVLILALLISPFQPGNGLSYLLFLTFASVWAMASKYILAINKKHIFNPAALAVAFTGLLVNQPATWWIGNAYMLPFVLLGGIPLVRKLRRQDVVWSFLIVATITIIIANLFKGTDPISTFSHILLRTPLFFFAFLMLTEPLTMPPTSKWRMSYGALVGFLFSPAIHVGSLYSTPELALLAGNIYSYLISPKEKLILTLKEKLSLSPDTYDFVFQADQPIIFRPGQYLEWTLGHNNPDNRGNRRYFTIASSPTEKDVRMGVKFYPAPSSFKQKLLAMENGEKIIASQLSGDFVLPRNKNQKLVFIAGGIGVTPFRSMIKYLLDQNEKRDIVVLYSNGTANEIVYDELFQEAQEKLGIRTIYTLTKKDDVPAGWIGRTGRIDSQMIQEEIPDYPERVFYLSGPHAMVSAFETTLKDMDISSSHIKTDFFPGFA